MARDITVTFDDGSTAIYKGAPDNVTPEAVTTRAQQDYGKTVTALDGGRKADQSGFIPALTSSFKAGAGQTAEALGELTGLEGLSKFGKEQQQKAAGTFKPTTEADIEAAKEKGILPAAGAYLSKYLTEPVGEAVGSIAGRYGAPAGIAGAGVLFPEAAVPLAAAGFATNASIHTGENLLRQKEQGQKPDYLSATTFGIGQAAIDQFAGHVLTGPMKSIIGKTALQEAELLAPRVLRGELSADEAAMMVGGKLRNVLQATAQNAVVGTGMMTADEALRRLSAGQDITSPEALETYKQQALAAAELSPLFGLHQGFGQPGKARAALEATEKLRPAPPAPPPAPPQITPVNVGVAADRIREMPGFTGVTNPNEAFLAQAREQQAQAAQEAENKRQAQIKSVQSTVYSSDPATDAAIKRRELASLGVTPEVQPPFEPIKVTTPQELAQERARNMPGFVGDQGGINDLMVNRPRELAVEQVQRQREELQSKVNEIRNTVYHPDEFQNALAQDRELQKLGFMPNVPIEVQLGETPEGKEIPAPKAPAQAVLKAEPPAAEQPAAEKAPAPPQPTEVLKEPEAAPSEAEQLKAQHDDLTKQMDALRNPKTGKPPTPLSNRGKQFSELADQRDEIANRLAEMGTPEAPEFQEARPIEGQPPQPMEPEEQAEYDAKLKEYNQALREARAQLNKAKKQGYSLFQALRGTLRSNEISVKDDPQYKQLLAKKGNPGVALSTLIEDGLLNDFLPPDNRPGMPNYDWKIAEDYIREKLYEKNYVTRETENLVESLGSSIEQIEESIEKHISLKDLNHEIQLASDEQRAADRAFEEIAPEGEARAPAPSEAENAREAFELKGETEAEAKARQAEAEARAAEEQRKAKEEEDRAKADAERESFILTGSDRPADEAAARGQMELVPAEKESAPAKPPVLEKPEGFPALKKGRNEQVVLAARELAAGRISKAEYDRYVNYYKPIGIVESPEAPLTNDGLSKVLNTAQRKKINPEISGGSKVGLRMDIKALERGDQLGLNGSVVAIHPKNNPRSTLGYSSAAHVTDATFAIRSEEAAMKVAKNEADKAPQQTIEGSWVKSTPEQIYDLVKQHLNNPAWTQVSFDPLRHSFFYDRETREPVLSASEVLQVGRFVLAKDAKFGNREDFLYMKDKATPEQRSKAEAVARDVMGDVVYQNGDLALVRGYGSRTGNPLLLGLKKNTYTTGDIRQYTGKMFTELQKRELMKAAEDYVKNSQEAFDKDSFVKFDKDGVGFSESVPSDLAGVLGGWKKLLKIDSNLYVTTVDDAYKNRNLFKGPHEPIGGLGDRPDTAGAMRRLNNGDYFIAFRNGTSKTKMLEVLSHELGHIHEREVFEKQDQATKDAIKADYDKWLQSAKKMTMRQFIDDLRARKIARGTEAPEGPATDIRNFDSYWASFREWYADQVSRWATTQEKPLTIVEKFFSKLGAAMKAFYQKVKNANYLPRETFRDYMDKVTEASLDSVSDFNQQKPLASSQMEFEFLNDQLKQKARDFFQDRPKMDEKVFEGVSGNLKDGINRFFYAPNKTIVDRAEALKGRMWQWVAQKTADEFRTAKQYSPIGHMQATLAKDTNGALEGLLFHGHVTLNEGALDIVKGSKGFIDAVKPLGKELDRFQIWYALNRESELPENKRSPVLAPLVESKDELIAGSKDGVSREKLYKDVQKDVNAVNKSVLNVALQTGLIDRDAYDKFSKDMFYIPFYRVLEDGRVESMNQAARLTHKEFSRMLKGNNEKPFGDLMENTLRNWSHILSASMKNQAANTIIGDAREMNAAEPALKPGLAWEDGKVVNAQTGNIYGNGELVQEVVEPDGKKRLISMTEAKEGQKDIVKTQVDGVTTYHHITDPMLLESIGAVSAGSPSGIAIDIMRPFKEILRFGVTASPTFKVANLIKDSLQSPSVSELSPNILKNIYGGLYDARKGSPIYQSALAGGGIFNYGSVLEGDRATVIKKLIAKGVDETSILDTPEKVKNFFGSMWHKYEELGNLSEAANRVALYKQLRDKGYTHLEASFKARDLMNFSAMGSANAIRFVANTVPFFNARIQGLYKLGRDGIIPTTRVIYNTVTGKPVEMSDAQKAKAFSTVAGAVCLASIALYMANKDDPDFQKREQWDRDFFWWGKVPGTDYAFRIPKPFEIGSLATMAERTVEQIVDSSAEGKRFGDSLSRMVWQTFSMNPVPQMFKPLVDIYANKNYFTNAPIETAGMEKLSKQERMTDQTSPLAKALGGVSHAFAPLTGDLGELSPVQIDYLLRGYMGWLGGTIAATSTEAVKPFNNGVYPNSDWTKTASLGFVEKLPSPQSTYLTDFYNNNQAIQQAYADMRHYAQLGQNQKVMEILAEKKNEIGLATFYDSTSKTLANVRKQLLIISNPNYTGLTPDQKQDEILRLKQIMSAYAQQAEQARKRLMAARQQP